MQPIFKDLPEMTMVGFGIEFDCAASMERDGMTRIPALWEQFNRRRGEIIAPRGPNSYSVMVSRENRNGMTYYAGIEVTDTVDLPDGMTGIVIPAGNYAVFTHHGPVSGIRQTMEAVYSNRVPQNHSAMRRAPHLEIYDQRFSPFSDDSRFEIGIPVR